MILTTRKFLAPISLIVEKLLMEDLKNSVISKLDILPHKRYVDDCLLYRPRLFKHNIPFVP